MAYCEKRRFSLLQEYFGMKIAAILSRSGWYGTGVEDGCIHVLQSKYHYIYLTSDDFETADLKKRQNLPLVTLFIAVLSILWY